jgi:[acyl-carrier-protein] S-malonyltransferase
MTTPVSIALLFPGQGTEAPGMSAGWEADEAWVGVLAAMEDASSFPLRRLMAEGPPEALRAPRVAPCAVVAHSVGLFRAHRRAGMPLPLVATGHSLGFFSAVVAAGVVPLEAIADLINAVEDLSEARFGPHTHGMAFFIGLTELELRQALVGHPEMVLSNLNGQAQFTVSGPRTALEILLENLGPQAMKSGLLPVRHPLHGVHMVPLLPEITRRLARWVPRAPDFPLLSHASGRWLRTGLEIWDEAIASVGLPVCWLEVVRSLQNQGLALFECGFGNQLANLTRWADRAVGVGSLQDPSLLSYWSAASPLPG